MDQEHPPMTLDQIRRNAAADALERVDTEYEQYQRSGGGISLLSQWLRYRAAQLRSQPTMPIMAIGMTTEHQQALADADHDRQVESANTTADEAWKQVLSEEEWTIYVAAEKYESLLIERLAKLAPTKRAAAKAKGKGKR